MTLGRAKAVISYVWVVIAVTILGIVFIQTLKGKYDFKPGDWDAGLAWAMPLVLPILGFIIPTWTLAGSARDQVIVKNVHVFVFALILSLLYFIALFVVLWQIPVEISDIEAYATRTLRTTSWVFGVFQVAVVAALGKFFLEEIYEPGRSEQPRKDEKTTN